MILNIFWILLGFVLLVKGGDYLVDGAVAIARRARLSAMVIGLTVVGFGTSTPELLVSSQAAWLGSSGIAIGNVAGSNIANVALILGLTALLRPLPSTRAMLRVDTPFMLLSMLLLVAAAATGTIQRWMGLTMFALLVLFVGWEIRKSRREHRDESDEANTLSKPDEADSLPSDTPPQSPSAVQAPMPLWRALLLVVVSIAAMMWGSNRLVEGASALALLLGEHLGVAATEMERIIGLTVVAVGTSLPELFASVMAAHKGETDMAVGNIIGSVTFNILCVVGISAAITPIPQAWSPFVFDYATMTALGLLLWLFLRTRHLLERWEGAILLLAYVAYLAHTFTF